jgi:CubicO group peptidase (beta-lactamase class C family)
MRYPILAATIFAILSQVASAQAVPAADPAALEKVRQSIVSGEFPNIHGVIVSVDGTIAAEWYFAGEDERRAEGRSRVAFTPQTLHDIRSASKSVVSLLFGIAMSQGAIKNLDAPVLDYFPEYKDLQTPERRRIRLKDILSMTSGLHWDENTYPYTDPRNSETAMDLAADRLRHILSQPIDTAPGQRWMYSGGDVALAAELIARAIKKPIDAFARENLFAPLGITEFEWFKDAKGIPIAASGLRLKPRDMLKIGLLMLDGGRVGGRQIVPPDWISASTTSKAVIDKGGDCATEYGYYWWLGPQCNPGFIGAIGNGGQRIWIIPAKRLVIVTTAGLYNSPEQAKIRLLVRALAQTVH